MDYRKNDNLSNIASNIADNEFAHGWRPLVKKNSKLKKKLLIIKFY